MRNFHEQQMFQLKTIINHSNESVSLIQIKKVFSSVKFRNQNQTFSIICAIVLKTSID